VLKPAVAMVAPSGIMVQVAAISVSQDADILVDALKKRGYTAVIRNEPQDKLLHVQLGPFASRAEASAMRTKLLADGYNAVVK
jgi:cell division septation protein DedD